MDPGWAWGGRCPIVSVVIPTKNRARSIARSVRSAGRQAGFAPGELEILVVDDGSSDDTAEQVGRLSGEFDQPVRLIANRRHPGANGARNTGIAASRGEWIALLDSDDSWAPDKLWRQLAAVRRAGCGAATCSWVVVRPGMPPEFRIYPRDVRFSGWDLTARLAWKTGFGTPTFLVHRDLVRRAGLFDEELRRRQDYEWTIRLAQHSDILAVARSVLLVHRQAASITGDPSLAWPATRSIMAKHRWLFARHPGSFWAQTLRVVRLRRAAKPS